MVAGVGIRHGYRVVLAMARARGLGGFREDVFLLLWIHQSVREMGNLARHTAQLKSAVGAAEESERRFRASFDQATVGMAQTTVEGALQEMNQRFCEIVGYSPTELLARNFRDLIHPDDMEGNERVIQSLLAGEIAYLDREKRYVHKQGHEVWVHTNVALVRDQQGQPLYMLAVVQDITEAKVAKEQLLRQRTKRFASCRWSPARCVTPSSSPTQTVRPNGRTMRLQH